MRKALVLALAALGMGVAMAAPVPLVADVTWNDGKRDGYVRFQGTADGEVLKGTVSDGRDEVRLVGRIASDGSVSGTLMEPKGRAIGSFQATLSDGQLVGAYTVGGLRRATWRAPADGLMRR